MASKERRPAGPRTPNANEKEQERDALIKECEDALEELMRDSDTSDDFETYERKLLELVHEIARRKLEKKLQTMSDGLSARLAIDRANDWANWREDTAFQYRRHCPGTVAYHSLVGPLRVRRYTYREHGSTDTCVPLDLAAGLMERMTPSLARCVAIGYAHMPLRTCEEMLVAGGLRPPSRSTLDRTARDLGAYAVSCNEVLEPQLRANEWTPASTRLIAIGLDRVAVPMRHGEEHEGLAVYCGPVRRDRPKPKPRTLLRGPVQWRMDYVGTVAFFDEEKRLLASRKYRVPGEADIAMIVNHVMADVRHALVQRPVSVAVIQDGAPELWAALETALEKEPTVQGWTEVLDWYHLDERLTKCLELCVEPVQRDSQRARWHVLLLDREHGADGVIRALRTKARSAQPDVSAQITTHVRYIEHNKHRMNYCDYRAHSVPIGSGVTEGACKSVVNVRAKRSGQRWSQRGLSAALHLRTIHESDRFDSFWSFFARRYRAAHIVPIGIDDPRAN